MTVIKSGTVSISSGSAAVEGTGTSWATGPNAARAGDTFMVPGAGFVSTIAAVASDTALTLESARAGAAISDAAFEIRLDAPARLTGVAGLAALAAMSARWQFLTKNVRMVDVLTVGLAAPPTAPAPVTGDWHVVGAAPTGAWAGYPHHYAIKIDGGWRFEAPARADGAADRATRDWWFYTGSEWSARSLDEGALRYDVAQALAAGLKTQALTNLGISHSAAVAETTQLATLAQLTALLPPTTPGQVFQNIGGALTARTVAQMLGGSTGVDYVVGTWNPALGSSGADPTITYTERTGWYMRLGRMVYIGGEVAGTRSGGTGPARIAGLPYPGGNQPIMVRATGVSVPGTIIAMPGSSGVAWLQYSAASSGAANDMQITNINASGFGLIFGGVYTT